MTLADTSVRINHLRTNDPILEKLLEDHQVVMHPMVIGELACSDLRDRERVLDLLKGLPQIPLAGHREVLFLIESHRLMGRGIGYIDAHLLAAVALNNTVRLWTQDRRLRAAADGLGLAFPRSV